MPAPDDELAGLRLERHGPVAQLTIDRPQARNSLTVALHEAFVRRFGQLQEDPEVRAIVVTGAHDPASPPAKQAFCVGADTTELAQQIVPGAGDRIPTLMTAPHHTPVIAAVNGYCIGAGLGIALAADLRVAAAEATFGWPEVELGTVPGNGGVRQALRELPYPVVMELLLRPGRMTAERALEIGMVNAVLPGPEVLPRALDWAAAIAALPADAVRAAMGLVDGLPRLDLTDAAALESDTIRALADPLGTA